MGRVQNPAEGAFRGAGRRGRFVFLGLLEGDPGLAFFGKQERGSAQALRKNARDQREKCVFVLTKGMSLIGPRPERPAFHEEFCKRIDGWDQRLLVKPGISGLAQVTGGYELLPKEKVVFDIRYIETRSISLDISIIVKTLKTVVSGDGAR